MAEPRKTPKPKPTGTAALGLVVDLTTEPAACRCARLELAAKFLNNHLGYVGAKGEGYAPQCDVPIEVAADLETALRAAARLLAREFAR